MINAVLQAQLAICRNEENMNQRWNILLKGLAAIGAVIVICVSISRMIGIGSETLGDIAREHPQPTATPREALGGTPVDSLGTTPGDSLGTTPGDSLGTTPGGSLGTTPGDSLGTTPGDSLGTTHGVNRCAICSE